MPTALIPLAEGCEEIEAVTLIDLLRRAEVEVTTAALTAEPVRASRGVVLVADTMLAAVAGQTFDLIALPGGGGGAERLRADARVLEQVRAQHAAGRYLAAICAAPSVLAAAGVLVQRRATSFPGWLDADAAPGLQLENAPVVRDGHIFTSRGPGTAMDFALVLIEALCGPDRAAEVERQLQRPPPGWRMTDGEAS